MELRFGFISKKTAISRALHIHSRIGGMAIVSNSVPFREGVTRRLDPEQGIEQGDTQFGLISPSCVLIAIFPHRVMCLQEIVYLTEEHHGFTPPHAAQTPPTPLFSPRHRDGFRPRHGHEARFKTGRGSKVVAWLDRGAVLRRESPLVARIFLPGMIEGNSR